MAARTQIQVPRINYRECLTPVRAFYLDLAHWAVEDPGRWAAWVAPSPVGNEEVNRRKDKQQRKSRMDARTRDRLPVLPVLRRTADRHRQDAAEVLDAARNTAIGQTFTAAGRTLVRVDSPRGAAVKVWAQDGAPATRHDLVKQEDHAFWTYAVIEVLRATGIRIEELTELSHHSLVQYRLPTTGEIVPLLQIAPSKSDAERLLVVSPELAEVLSAVISRVRGTNGAIPLVAAYDHHERRLAATTAAAVPASRRQRATRPQCLGDPLHARRRHRRHAAHRTSDRPTAALHPARLPKALHHRRRPQRATAPHRPSHRRAPRHQRHHGLQGRLPRRSHPSASGVPGPPPRAASHRRIPCTHR